MSYQRVPAVDVDDDIPLTAATELPSNRLMTQPIEQQQQHDLEIAFSDPLSATTPLLADDSPPPQPPTAAAAATGARYIQPTASTNDGVFSNIAAKPELESSSKDMIPPTYDEAVADATPPYWHTAVVAPCDDILLIEGLPVGSFFQFAWNLMISVVFQFVGFLLTMLFRTSHAAKYGSQAGLGVTFFQLGFLMREDDYDNNARTFVSYFVMICGWVIIICSVIGYMHIKRLERIIFTQPDSAERIV